MLHSFNSFSLLRAVLCSIISRAIKIFSKPPQFITNFFHFSNHNLVFLLCFVLPVDLFLYPAYSNPAQISQQMTAHSLTYCMPLSAAVSALSHSPIVITLATLLPGLLPTTDTRLSSNQSTPHSILRLRHSSCRSVGRIECHSTVSMST